MRIAVITDTHAGARSDSPIFNEYFIKFYEQIFFPYLKENNIRTVLHLGDVFDRRKYINFSTLTSWQERVFNPLHELIDRMDIIVGNHDTYFKNTNNVNSVEALLSGYQKFNIHTRPTEMSLGGVKMLYLPWICEDNVELSHDLIVNTAAQICVGHLELMGFEMHAGHINQDKGISPSLFDKFFLTMTGHFHHKSNKGGINYLGSPYPIYWYDWGDIRGFHVFDTETMSLEFIENPLQIFVKLFYDDVKSSYNVLVQERPELCGMYVKIIVQNKTNPYWFDQFIESIQKSNPADINIVEAALDVNDVGDEVIDQAKDTLHVLQDCVKCLELPAYENDLLSLFSELYVEAVNMSDQI